MTKTLWQFAPGTILANGSFILKQKGDIVLCFIPHNDVTPFATWAIGGDGDTFHGDYFRDIDSAMSGFIRRFERG
jgi:hypothetical protein